MNLLEKFGRQKRLRNVATAYSSFVNRKQGIVSDLGRNYSSKVATSEAQQHSAIDLSFVPNEPISMSAIGIQEMNVNSAAEFERPYVASIPVQSVFQNKKRKLKIKDE